MMIHFLEYMFWGKPWYIAAIWGNIFVGFVAVPLGWIWSKTKYWPWKQVEAEVERLHKKHHEIEDSLAALHEKHDKLIAQHEILIQNQRDLHASVQAIRDTAPVVVVEQGARPEAPHEFS